MRPTVSYLETENRALSVLCHGGMLLAHSQFYQYQLKSDAISLLSKDGSRARVNAAHSVFYEFL